MYHLSRHLYCLVALHYHQHFLLVIIRMYHVLKLCYCLVAHHCHEHFDTVTFLYLLIDFHNANWVSWVAVVSHNQTKSNDFSDFENFRNHFRVSSEK